MNSVSRRDPARLRRVMAVAAVCAGAAVLAGSGFAVWLDAAGSRLSGFRLAELIGGYGGRVPGVPPAWVGAVWYLFPASAGACWILLFRRSPPAVSGAHGLIGAAIAAAAAVYVVRVDSLAGPMLALAAGLIVVLGSLAGRQPRDVDRTD